jgi:hypothetical protein
MGRVVPQFCYCTCNKPLMPSLFNSLMTFRYTLRHTTNVGGGGGGETVGDLKGLKKLRQIVARLVCGIQVP